MYETQRTALYAHYQEAITKIALLSLRDLAETVRTLHPTAAVIELESSDQGDYLRVVTVTDTAGDTVVDGEDLDEQTDGLVMATAGNLTGNTYTTWSAFMSANNRRRGNHTLPVDAALAIDPVTFDPDIPWASDS